jgi:hypothetical protein
MTDLVAPCRECGRVFNQTKLADCPGCARAGTEKASTPSRTHFSKLGANSSDEPAWAANLVAEMRLVRFATQSTANQLAALAAFLWLTLVTATLSALFLTLAIVFKPYDFDFNLFWLTASAAVTLMGSCLALWSLFEAAMPKLRNRG